MTDAPGLQFVAQARRRGVRIVWDPARFRGPADALALVKEVPETAREILRRAEAFRRQADAWAVGVPLLALPDAPAPREGSCISCGAPLVPEQAWRCPTCRAAVELTLGLAPDG